MPLAPLLAQHARRLARLAVAAPSSTADLTKPEKPPFGHPAHNNLSGSESLLKREQKREKQRQNKSNPLVNYIGVRIAPTLAKISPADWFT
jgi:hypothetical protein